MLLGHGGFGNAPWEQSFWPLHGLLLNKPTVARYSLPKHRSSGLWGARYCIFTVILKSIFSPCYWFHPLISWGIPVKFPEELHNGRRQPFPGQLECIIISIIYVANFHAHFSHLMTWEPGGWHSTGAIPPVVLLLHMGEVNKSNAGIRKGHTLCFPQPYQPGALLVHVHDAGQCLGKPLGGVDHFSPGDSVQAPFYITLMTEFNWQNIKPCHISIKNKWYGPDIWESDRVKDFIIFPPS